MVSGFQKIVSDFLKPIFWLFKKQTSVQLGQQIVMRRNGKTFTPILLLPLLLLLNNWMGRTMATRGGRRMVYQTFSLGDAGDTVECYGRCMHDRTQDAQKINISRCDGQKIHLRCADGHVLKVCCLFLTNYDDFVSKVWLITPWPTTQIFLLVDHVSIWNYWCIFRAESNVCQIIL